MYVVIMKNPDGVFGGPLCLRVSPFLLPTCFQTLNAVAIPASPKWVGKEDLVGKVVGQTVSDVDW